MTDAEGKVLETLDAGKQVHMTAQESEWIIPDDCKVTKVNFKNARLALRMLGAGDSGLPAGYTRVEFIHRSNQTGDSYWLPKEQFVDRVGIRLKGYKFIVNGGTHQRFGVHTKCYLETPNANTFTVVVGGSTLITLPTATNTNFEWRACYRGTDEVALKTTEGEASAKTSYVFKPSSITLFGCEYGSSVGYSGRGRISELCVSEGVKLMYVLRPCVRSDGSLVFVCAKTGKETETVTSSYRNYAGLTLAQCVTLCRNLSSTGGTLQVALPEGYNSVASVNDALESAKAKGWQITIQTYAPVESAATYALRRVWVRRAQDELGDYVDAENKRWHVEWSVDVIGADPEELGYERFRSVDAAVAYWELTPFMPIEPETEPETLTETE